MIRGLARRIAALWGAACAGAAARRPTAATAKETETMNARRLVEKTGLIADEAGWPRAGAGRDDLPARAMADLGIDVAGFSLREAKLLRDMGRICRSCAARSRCRRDLGTGDFARRYRHYCPHAALLDLIAAEAAAGAGTGRGGRHM